MECVLRYTPRFFVVILLIPDMAATRERCGNSTPRSVREDFGRAAIAAARLDAETGNEGRREAGSSGS
jgi:hypothetical protein